MASAYSDTGWKADWCSLAALVATAPTPELGARGTAAEDRVAVVAALHALYLPRLEREASILQQLLHPGVPPPRTPGQADTLVRRWTSNGIAQRLAMLLRTAGAPVKLAWRWTGFPTATATCKPLASPAADRFHGGTADASRR